MLSLRQKSLWLLRFIAQQVLLNNYCSTTFNETFTEYLSMRRMLISRRSLLAGSVAAISSTSLVSALRAQDANETEPKLAETEGRIKYDSPEVQNWKIGLELETPVTCTNVFASFPIPMNWPEQTVTVTGKEIDRSISAWKVRDIGTGVKQVILKIPRVVAGGTAKLLLELAVEKSRILAPTRTDDLVIPKRPGREERLYLSSSPYIDTKHARIKAVSKELESRDAENAWDRVEQIYDWVRENVQYVEGDLKNASMALKDGKGDCEEMTSLVVALCRNAKVPARMVWVPGHCYPEFYLEDGDGKGYWFPCQAAGTRQFGRMDEYRPVLQKGDKFKVPEKKTPVRYVAEFFKCDRKGNGNPRPKFIRDQIEI